MEYTIQVNIVRKDFPDELVESFKVVVEPNQNLGTALGQALSDNNIDETALEHYKVEVELADE